jgi:ABC-type transporter MlaC component
MKFIFLSLICAFVSLTTVSISHAENSVKTTAKKVFSDVKDGAKKVGSDVQNATCKKGIPCTKDKIKGNFKKAWKDIKSN